ncbi:hypothetical protein GQ600_7742 [Phytophthora cactorum]|nr:hypothetical protein GQ600_7742 [Phytophthora cactorum]
MDLYGRPAPRHASSPAVAFLNERPKSLSFSGFKPPGVGRERSEDEIPHLSLPDRSSIQQQQKQHQPPLLHQRPASSRFLNRPQSSSGVRWPESFTVPHEARLRPRTARDSVRTLPTTIPTITKKSCFLQDIETTIGPESDGQENEEELTGFSPNLDEQYLQQLKADILHLHNVHRQLENEASESVNNTGRILRSTATSAPNHVKNLLLHRDTKLAAAKAGLERLLTETLVSLMEFCLAQNASDEGGCENVGSGSANVFKMKLPVSIYAGGMLSVLQQTEDVLAQRRSHVERPQRVHVLYKEQEQENTPEPVKNEEVDQTKLDQLARLAALEKERVESILSIQSLEQQRNELGQQLEKANSELQGALRRLEIGEQQHQESMTAAKKSFEEQVKAMEQHAADLQSSLASTIERYRYIENAASQEKTQLRRDKQELERLIRLKEDEVGKRQAQATAKAEAQARRWKPNSVGRFLLMTRSCRVANNAKKARGTSGFLPWNMLWWLRDKTRRYSESSSARQFSWSKKKQRMLSNKLSCSCRAATANLCLLERKRQRDQEQKAFEEKLKEYTDRVVNLSSEKDALQREIEALRSQYQQLQQVKEQSGYEAAAIEKKLQEELAGKPGRHHASLSELRVELQKAKQKIAALEEQLSRNGSIRTSEIDGKLAQLSARERRVVEEQRGLKKQRVSARAQLETERAELDQQRESQEAVECRQKTDHTLLQQIIVLLTQRLQVMMALFETEPVTVLGALNKETAALNAVAKPASEDIESWRELQLQWENLRQELQNVDWKLEEMCRQLEALHLEYVGVSLAPLDGEMQSSLSSLLAGFHGPNPFSDAVAAGRDTVPVAEQLKANRLGRRLYESPESRARQVTAEEHETFALALAREMAAMKSGYERQLEELRGELRKTQQHRLLTGQRLRTELANERRCSQQTTQQQAILDKHMAATSDDERQRALQELAELVGSEQRRRERERLSKLLAYCGASSVTVERRDRELEEETVDAVLAALEEEVEELNQ